MGFKEQERLTLRSFFACPFRPYFAAQPALSFLFEDRSEKISDGIRSGFKKMTGKGELSRVVEPCRAFYRTADTSDTLSDVPIKDKQ